MRANLKSIAIASLAALALVAATAKADARPWRNYGHGWGGPGLVFGFVAATIATAAIVNSRSCIRYRPVYDAYGNYAGRQAVNVCP